MIFFFLSFFFPLTAGIVKHQGSGCGTNTNSVSLLQCNDGNLYASVAIYWSSLFWYIGIIVTSPDASQSSGVKALL